jgi:hypothetical protein
MPLFLLNSDRLLEHVLRKLAHQVLALLLELFPLVTQVLNVLMLQLLTLLRMASFALLQLRLNLIVK